MSTDVRLSENRVALKPQWIIMAGTQFFLNKIWTSPYIYRHRVDLVQYELSNKPWMDLDKHIQVGKLFRGTVFVSPPS